MGLWLGDKGESGEHEGVCECMCVKGGAYISLSRLACCGWA